jgi:hypothetical protein
MPNPLMIPLLRWLGRLSYPKLFVFAAALFVVTLVVPDPLPLVDELLFGLGALLLARRKRQPQDAAGKPAIDGEAKRG